MTRSTTQARMRTTAGRPLSVISQDTGRPVMVLRQNLAGPIQIQLQDPADATHMVGMLPKYFVIHEARLIVPADAGTVQIVLPAYNGLPSVTMNTVADAADAAAGTAITLDAGGWASYAQDRPVHLVTAGVTGLLGIGLFGFPLDDGTDETN